MWVVRECAEKLADVIEKRSEHVTIVTLVVDCCRGIFYLRFITSRKSMTKEESSGQLFIW